MFNIVSIIARIVLFMIGWSPIERKTFSKLLYYRRVLVVFSHSSYYDFYIMIIYILAYPEELAHVRTLVKPQPFKYFGWLLKRFGAIPSTRIEDKSGGAVDRIVEELNNSKDFIFLISPKGSILFREWRSGFYHIAQKLQVPIIVVGFDYEDHCVYVSDKAINYSKSYEEVVDFCKNYLGEITPLHPKHEINYRRPSKLPTAVGVDLKSYKVLINFLIRILITFFIVYLLFHIYESV